VAIQASSFIQVHPSFTEPELLMTYNQASGAFDTLPGSAPRIKLGDGDLAVYGKRIDLRTRVMASQSAANQLPSCTIVASQWSLPTYLLRTRAEYDHHDTAAASNWGIDIVSAHRLGMRQGTFQLMRNLLLVGANPSGGEGLLNSAGATAVSLPADSNGNDTIVTYDNGQLGQFLVGLIGQIKQQTNQLGIGRKFVWLMPQRIGVQIEYKGIVTLIQFQRTGAGTATTAGLVKMIAMENGDEVYWGYDDTLIGKGAGGTDAILLVMPEVQRPFANQINTNEFASLAPSMDACTLMYADMPAPREIPVPIAGGAIDITSELRVSPGVAIRPEAEIILSATYQ
jgi:hypothetical protein